MQTYMAIQQIERKWYVVDAEGCTLAVWHLA